MTTERQRAANQRNASKSTGPRSAAGKARASKNAITHGLSSNIAGDAGAATAIARLAGLIAGTDPDLFQAHDARIAAEANLELGRIRTFQASRLNLQAPLSVADPKSRSSFRAAVREVLLQRSKIERYERRAFSKRNRALRRAADVSND